MVQATTLAAGHDLPLLLCRPRQAETRCVADSAAATLTMIAARRALRMNTAIDYSSVPVAADHACKHLHGNWHCACCSGVTWQHSICISITSLKEGGNRLRLIAAQLCQSCRAQNGVGKGQLRWRGLKASSLSALDTRRLRSVAASAGQARRDQEPPPDTCILRTASPALSAVR